MLPPGEFIYKCISLSGSSDSKNNNCATIKTSYGCPYKCNFCFCTQICEYSSRELNNTLDELQSIEE